MIDVLSVVKMDTFSKIVRENEAFVVTNVEEMDIMQICVMPQNISGVIIYDFMNKLRLHLNAKNRIHAITISIV